MLAGGLQRESLHQCIEDFMWTAVQEWVTPEVDPMASA